MNAKKDEYKDFIDSKRVVSSYHGIEVKQNQVDLFQYIKGE